MTLLTESNFRWWLPQFVPFKDNRMSLICHWLRRSLLKSSLISDKSKWPNVKAGMTFGCYQRAKNKNKFTGSGIRLNSYRQVRYGKENFERNSGLRNRDESIPLFRPWSIQLFALSRFRDFSSPGFGFHVYYSIKEPFGSAICSLSFRCCFKTSHQNTSGYYFLKGFDRRDQVD